MGGKCGDYCRRSGEACVGGFSEASAPGGSGARPEMKVGRDAVDGVRVVVVERIAQSELIQLFKSCLVDCSAPRTTSHCRGRLNPLP